MIRISQGSIVLGLVALAGPTQAQATLQTTAADTCITFKRLWSGGIMYHSSTGWVWSFTYSTPSPDGRYVTWKHPSSGDLAVWDLGAGELVRVTDKGLWSDSIAWAESSVFSPDGSKLAYLWHVSGHYETRVANLDGSDFRTLLIMEEGPYSLEDWSPDGEQILVLKDPDVLQRGPGFWQLMTISASDGSVRVLKTFDRGHPQLASFSPDGRYVAYDLPSDREGQDRDVYTLSIEGNEETLLLGGPEDDRFWGWLPEGEGILFYSDRGSTRGIWRLPLGLGVRAEDAVLVRGEVWKVWPLGSSQNAYYYGVVLEEPLLEIKQVNSETAEVVGTPEPASDPTAGTAGDPAWSPDGQYLAYKLRRHPNLVYSTHRAGETQDRLIIRSSTGEDTRELNVALQEWERIRWMPDASAVVVAGIDADQNRGIFRLDLMSGLLTRLYLGPPQNYELSPNGHTLYVIQWADSEWQVVAHDVETSQEVVLTTSTGWPNFVPSPDGRWLAVKMDSSSGTGMTIAVIPATGGQVRELVHGHVLELFLTNWTPDGKRVVFTTWDYEADPATRTTHWTIAPTGGVPERLGSPRPMGSEHLRAPTVHPDGSRIATSSWFTRGEIWVIENPSEKVCRKER